MTIRTDIGGAPVLAGPWPDPVVPDISLPEFLLATATQQAERAARIDASSGRTLHYAELADGVRRVASGLAALGLRPGNVFAIMAPNSPEWLLACCGALAARGVVTGINPLCTPGEVATTSPRPAWRAVGSYPNASTGSVARLMTASPEPAPAMQSEDLGEFFLERANDGDVEGLVAPYEPGAVLAFPPGTAGHRA